MEAKTLAAIHAHALAQYPDECCGLIVAVGRREVYVPCRNMSQNARDNVVVNPEDYAAAEDMGAVMAFVHSHPDALPIASGADLAGCEASGLPWHILGVERGAAGALNTYHPTGWEAPLLGREFFHGALDCYTLIRDFYARELGITLPQAERADEWWNKGQDLYTDNYARAGFRVLGPEEPLEFGDVVLMQVRSPVPNHGGVFLGAAPLKEAPDLFPVPDAMLHHLYGRLSERVVYGGYWAECTRMKIRYMK